MSSVKMWKWKLIIWNTHSMLCRNSPLGRLNFFMLSADADANAFLKKGCYIKVHNIVEKYWKSNHGWKPTPLDEAP